MFYTAKEASFFNLMLTWSFGRESFSIRIVEWKALQGVQIHFQIAPRRRTFRKVLEIFNQSSRRAGARPSRATRRVSPSHVSSWINAASTREINLRSVYRAAGGAERKHPRPASERIVTFQCWKSKKERRFSHVVRRSNQRFSSQSKSRVFLFLVTLLSMQWKNHPFLFACPVR